MKNKKPPPHKVEVIFPAEAANQNDSIILLCPALWIFSLQEETN